LSIANKDILQRIQTSMFSNNNLSHKLETKASDLGDWERALRIMSRVGA